MIWKRVEHDSNLKNHFFPFPVPSRNGMDLFFSSHLRQRHSTTPACSLNCSEGRDHFKVSLCTPTKNGLEALAAAAAFGCQEMPLPLLSCPLLEECANEFLRVALWCTWYCGYILTYCVVHLEPCYSIICLLHAGALHMSASGSFGVSPSLGVNVCVRVCDRGSWT